MATSAGGNVDRTITRRGLLVGAAAASAFLAAPATASAAVTAGHAEARARLRELERCYAGRIGAYALDTGTGATFGHRAYERFPLLSTFKMLASGAILRANERGPGLLDRLIRWTKDDLVPNSPVTELHVDTGLTIAELCHAAITRSDNTAGNLLLRQLGGPPAITRFARTLGDPVTRLDRWEIELNDWFPGERRDTTVPAAQAHNLRALTLGRALGPAGRERLLGWLRANTTGGARIRAGLPPSWTIGDKTGSSSSYGAANDIAVATPLSGAPLILAIYTNRNAADAPYDNQVIADTATILATALHKL